jgi:AcrR family transcriptional regulator
MKTIADTPPASRTAILDSAEELFAVQGFVATSVKQIGERADANPALIYYYFGDKQGLYRAVLQRIGATLRDSVRAHGDPEAIGPQIERLVAAQAALINAHPRAVMLIARELLDHGAEHAQPMIHGLAAELFRPTVEAIEVARACGTVRADVRAEFALLSTISQMFYFALAKPLVRVLLQRGADYPTAAEVTAFGEHAAQFALSGMGVTTPGSRR